MTANGWKVVADPINKTNTDYFISIFSLYRYTYRINQPTVRKPHTGPLAVFRTRATARNFRKMRNEGRIFKCKYEPSKEEIFYYLALSISGKYVQITNLGVETVPEGTIFAESVTLLK